MMLFSLASFAQDLSDKTIGFDINKITTSLKERSVSDSEMAYEIQNAREMFQTSYKTIKIAQDKIQNENKLQQTLKTTNNKSARNLAIVQDIPPTEKEALLALYNSTNGDNWINKTGWDFNTPVTTFNSSTGTGWYGVTVINNHVRYMQLSENNLVGTIPSQIGQLTELEVLQFSSNKIHGTIPNEIYKLTKIRQIYLYSNNLQGSISPNIGQLVNLNILYLNFNKLNGGIPFQISNLSKLQHLMLAYNELSGVLPSEMSRLNELTVFAILRNKFEGTLPNFTNTNLTNLNISDNKFRFSDFITEYATYKNRMGQNFRYANQELTDIAKTITGTTGGTISLTMHEDGRFSPQDSYQWYKNNILIPGATSRTYTISDLQNINTGSYNCISQNPEITDLILTRNTIQLNVIPCTPIIGKITINPCLANVITTPSSQTIISGNSTNISLTSTTPGTTFKWAVIANGVTGALSGSGNTITQTLTNTGTVTYTVTPMLGICSGKPVTIIVTVESIYKNSTKSGLFTRNNCGTGGTGTTVTYTVPANTYSSTSSQADADAKAQNDVNTNGQVYANTNGNCSYSFVNSAKSGLFTRNNCGTGGTGTTVTYTVPANTYSSTSSQADADAQAQNDVNTNGQVYANTNGNCSYSFVNSTKSGLFTRNNCGAGGAGTTVTYTVPANTYSSTSSQADADAKAQNDVNTNGQAYANTNGNCSYSFVNSAKSGLFTRNNCGAGGAGTTVTYTVPANTYSSTSSQADADAKAQNDVNTNGQAYANTNGTCSYYYDFSSSGKSSSSLACSETSFPLRFYSASNTLTIGTRMYSDPNLTAPILSDNLWYKLGANNFSYRIASNNRIVDITECEPPYVVYKFKAAHVIGDPEKCQVHYIDKWGQEQIAELPREYDTITTSCVEFHVRTMILFEGAFPCD